MSRHLRVASAGDGIRQSTGSRRPGGRTEWGGSVPEARQRRLVRPIAYQCPSGTTPSGQLSSSAEWHVPQKPSAKQQSAPRNTLEGSNFGSESAVTQIPVKQRRGDCRVRGHAGTSRRDVSHDAVVYYRHCLHDRRRLSADHAPAQKIAIRIIALVGSHGHTAGKVTPANSSQPPYPSQRVAIKQGCIVNGVIA